MSQSPPSPAHALGAHTHLRQWQHGDSNLQARQRQLAAAPEARSLPHPFFYSLNRNAGSSTKGCRLAAALAQDLTPQAGPPTWRWRCSPHSAPPSLRTPRQICQPDCRCHLQNKQKTEEIRPAGAVGASALRPRQALQPQVSTRPPPSSSHCAHGPPLPASQEHRWPLCGLLCKRDGLTVTLKGGCEVRGHVESTWTHNFHASRPACPPSTTHYTRSSQGVGGTGTNLRGPQYSQSPGPVPLG